MKKKAKYEPKDPIETANGLLGEVVLYHEDSLTLVIKTPNGERSAIPSIGVKNLRKEE